MEPATCHLSGAKNFEVTSTFLENLNTFVLYNAGTVGMEGELFLTSTLTILVICTNKCIYTHIETLNYITNAATCFGASAPSFGSFYIDC